MYALHHNLGHAPIDFFQIILYYLQNVNIQIFSII